MRTSIEGRDKESIGRDSMRTSIPEDMFLIMTVTEGEKNIWLSIKGLP